jgi:hypothetical protein
MKEGTGGDGGVSDSAGGFHAGVSGIVSKASGTTETIFFDFVAITYSS